MLEIHGAGKMLLDGGVTIIVVIEAASVLTRVIKSKCTRRCFTVSCITAHRCSTFSTGKIMGKCRSLVRNCLAWVVVLRLVFVLSCNSCVLNHALVIWLHKGVVALFSQKRGMH